MRQNRKLPGQNPYPGHGNFPKSDSRTQMLRSGSNEAEGKARDLHTGHFTGVVIRLCCAKQVSVDSWIRLLGINEIESDWYP